MQRTVIAERYVLNERLGGGGVAEVYLAYDGILDRDVAIKLLKDRYAADEEFIERFEREARSAARLSHPNIVSIYDQGRLGDGRYYVVMEYASPGTLEEQTRRGGSMEPVIAAGVALQVADALSAAHGQGMIHAGVKPRNVLVTREGGLKDRGDVKVTDFGVARAVSSSPAVAPVTVLSAAGYMSPEQAKGEPVGVQSDLYSLGVVLYEMLTGKPPYLAEDPITLANMHANEPPRSPREANPAVPEALDAITLKLLTKNPRDRYASAAALVDDLGRARSSGLPSVRVPERRRKGMLVPVVSVSLLFALVLFGGLVWALAAQALNSESPGDRVRPSARETARASGRQGQAPAPEIKKLEEELRGVTPVPGSALQGSNGTDALQGTDEQDALGGLSGDDEMSGYDGGDRISGDTGNDTLFGGAGSDVLLGGNGNDTLDDGDDSIEDTLRCGQGFDTVTAGPEDNVINCENVTIR